MDFFIRTAHNKDYKFLIDILASQWDLGRVQSGAPADLCARIYLYDILSGTDELVTAVDGDVVLGFAGYGIFGKNKLRKSFYARKQRRLMKNKSIPNPRGIIDYYNAEQYRPAEIRAQFNGELSILIVDQSAQKHGVGTALFTEICKRAKRAGMKTMMVDTDDYKTFAYPNGNEPRRFYEKCGCECVYAGTTTGISTTVYTYKMELKPAPEFKFFTEISAETMDEIIKLHFDHWSKFYQGMTIEKTENDFKHVYTQTDRIPFGIAMFLGRDLIGFCRAKETQNECPEFSPWISAVMVKEKYRGQGYGKIMVRKIMEIMKSMGFKKTYIMTNTTPEFYESLGFKYIKTVTVKNIKKPLDVYDITL